jgi:hypothetical protein
MQFLGFLFTLHSIVRWVLVVVAVGAVIKFALGLIRKSEYSKLDNGLIAGFSGLMDLQVLLGLIYLIWSGVAFAGFPRYRLEHTFVMILAVVVAHLPARWKNKPGSVRYRNGLLALAGALVLVVIGVGLLGWSRWIP